MAWLSKLGMNKLKSMGILIKKINNLAFNYKIKNNNKSNHWMKTKSKWLKQMRLWGTIVKSKYKVLRVLMMRHKLISAWITQIRFKSMMNMKIHKFQCLGRNQISFLKNLTYRQIKFIQIWIIKISNQFYNKVNWNIW